MPSQWLHVALCAWISSMTGATKTVPSISLPSWAVELNAAQEFAGVPYVGIEHDAEIHHHVTLLEWANRRDGAHLMNPSGARTDSLNLFLLVGAKTNVVHGFSRRQAIRQTWGDAPFVPSGVHVVFLGCESDLSTHSPAKQQQLRHAIELEKRVFGDLLTTELLQCHDSFAQLPNKVKAFMHWAATTYPTLAYVMVVDDDVYLRLDRLTELLRRSSTPRTRFYAGNSASNDNRGLATPVRDPRNKYFISARLYPMKTLPPFLTGAHFILSGDLVRFLARNFYDLRGVESLDDVTVGLWLFGLLRIKQTFFDDFQVLRTTNACVDELISLADLTVSATRFMHANVVHGRRLCENFDTSQRLKTARAVVVPASFDANTVVNENEDDCFLHWDFQHNGASNRLEIFIELTVGASAVGFFYVPSHTTAEDGFCGQAASLLRERLYLAVAYQVCEHHCGILLSSIAHDLQAKPALGPFLSIAYHNLRQMQINDEADNAARIAAQAAETSYVPVMRRHFTAVLSARASALRPLIECLLVELNPDQQVIVINEDDDGLSPRERIDMFVLSTTDGEQAVEEAHGRATNVLLVQDPSSRPAFWRSMDTTRVVVLTTELQDVSTEERNLPLLPAARLFGRTMNFTPTMLLRPQPKQAQVTTSERRRIVVFAPSSESSSNVLPPFLQALDGVMRIDFIGLWSHCTVSTHEDDRFCLDEAVEILRDAAFAFVVADDFESWDLVSDRIVMAFLAGAVPVYIGKAPAAALFVPKAFIDCGMFEHLYDCAAHVQKVDQSPHLLAQMRQEAAVVDMGVFDDVFSWHPEVSRAMAARDESKNRVSMAQRLQVLLSGDDSGY